MSEINDNLPPPEDRMTTKEVADYLGLKPATITHWRSSGRYDLDYYRRFGRVIYSRKTVEEFENKASEHIGFF